MRGAEVYGQDRQAAGGGLPQSASGVIFNPNIPPPEPPVIVIPKPFDYWSVLPVTLAANVDNWLDRDNKPSNRRAWAVMNGSAVVGNNFFVSPVAMIALGQGGLCPAPFGWLSVPGGSRTEAHAWTAIVGLIIYFYQFA